MLIVSKCDSLHHLLMSAVSESHVLADFCQDSILKSEDRLRHHDHLEKATICFGNAMMAAVSFIGVHAYEFRKSP